MKGRGQPLTKENLPAKSGSAHYLRTKSQPVRPLSQNEVNYNALIEAVQSLNTGRLTELLDKLNNYKNEEKISVCKNKIGDNILFYAVQATNSPIIKIILDKVPGLLTSRTKDGENALHLAVIRGNIEIINLLLGKDTSLLEQKNLSKHTPLQIAIEGNNKPTIKCIIKFIRNEPLVDKLTKLGVDLNNEIVAKIIKKLELSMKLLAVTSFTGKAEQPMVDYNNENIILKILRGELNFQKYKNTSSKINIVEVLNLKQQSEPEIVRDSISKLVNKLENNNIRLSIPLHLGENDWASLTIQRIGDEEFRIVYRHPKGESWKNNKDVKRLIDYIDFSDLRITSLPAGTMAGSDSPDIPALTMIAAFVNTAPTDLSASRYVLYESTTKTGQNFDNERKKHLIMLDEKPVYGEHKMQEILRGSLEGIDKQVEVSAVLNMVSINPDIINHAINMAFQEYHVIVPVKTYRGGWACMILKHLPTSELVLITQDPMGDAMCNNTRGWFEVSTTILSKVQFLNINDLRKVQTDNIEDTGTITADNIKSIMKSAALIGLPGPELYKKIKDNEEVNILSLRKADEKVLIDHHIPVGNYYDDAISPVPATNEETVPVDITGNISLGEGYTM